MTTQEMMVAKLSRTPRAFAVNLNNEIIQVGMSLRDYFAGQAISGLLSERQNRVCESLKELVDCAYQVSDLMMEQHAKQEEKSCVN